MRWIPALLKDGWMELSNLVQWPAMALTLYATWLVASTRPSRRSLAFWVFIASNVLWVIWGLHADAYALILLQVGLFAMNIRGAKKAEHDSALRQGS